MTVQAILASKGRDVTTIEPTASIDDAARLLAARQIGALVVTGAEQRVVGIISERDIVQIVAVRGAPALGLPLSEVMTRRVTTCSPTDTISSIMERMTAGKFRHVPVVEQGRPIRLTGPAVGALLYLTLLGTAVAFVLYFWLLRHMSATTLSLTAYAIPVVALAVGAVLFGEPITARVLAGAALVIAGTALASRRGSPAARARAAGAE